MTEPAEHLPANALMNVALSEYDPRPADVLVFSAPWNQASGWIIKAATLSPFSHFAGVAMIEPSQLEAEVRRRKWPQKPDAVACALYRLLAHVGFERRMLLVESTTLCGEACELTGQRHDGVQAHEPRRRLAAYLRSGGRAWLLRPTGDYALQLNQVARLSEFLLRHLGAPYDFSQAALAGTRVLRRFCRVSDASLAAVFCSELWAAALEQIRLLPLRNPSVFTPASLVRSLVELGSYRWVGEFSRGPGSKFQVRGSRS